MKKLTFKTFNYNPGDPYNFPQERQVDFYKQLSKIFLNSIELLRKSNYQFQDFRSQVFDDILMTTNSAKVFSILIDDHTSNTVWWNKHPKLLMKKVKNKEAKNLNVELRTYIDFAYFHTCFMFVEENFRKFLREIDPAVLKDATGGFYKVHSCLFEILKIDKKKNKLMEFFAIIRNSIHNNGLYYPQNTKIKTITFKGRKFKLEYGKGIIVGQCGYIDKYEFFLNLLNEINDLLLQVVFSKKIASLRK